MSTSATIPVFDPQGTLRDIPQEQLADAVRAGGMPAVKFQAPDKSIRFVPANRTHEAYQAGGQIVPIQDQDIKHPGFWNSLWGDIKSMPAALAGPDPLADPRVSDAEKNQIVAQQQAQAASTNAARAQKYGQGYSLASTAGEMLGVPVSGMEQSAEHGDVGGVLGHAATMPAVTAATAGLGRVASDIPLSRATAPVRAAIRGANVGLERAPGTLGGMLGAGVGGYLGGHVGAEVGGIAGTMAGRELLPSVRIPGENIGLPGRVTGGPVNAPQYAAPGQAGSIAASVAAPIPQAVPAAPTPSNFPTAASRAASDLAFNMRYPKGEIPGQPMDPIAAKAWDESMERRSTPRVDTDALSQAYVKARAELGQDASSQLVAKRAQQIAGVTSGGGDIGQQSRQVNPEPTRAEVKAAQNPTAQLSDLLDESLGVKKPVPGVRLRDQAAAQAATENNIPEGHTPVESSALKSYKYDPSAREFTAATKSGPVQYVYGDVSQEDAAAFEKASSKGKAWQDIRNSGTLVAKIVDGKRIPIRPARPTAETGDLSDLLNKSVQAVKAKKLATGEGTP